MEAFVSEDIAYRSAVPSGRYISARLAFRIEVFRYLAGESYRLPPFLIILSR